MHFLPTIKKLEEALAGEPDSMLTLLLLGIAAFTVIVALNGTPLLKAAVAVWLLAP